VKAHHVNWAWAAKPEFTAENPEPEYSEREKAQLKQGERWYPFGTGEGRGYIAIQSTRVRFLSYFPPHSEYHTCLAGSGGYRPVQLAKPTF
jgi:hypothetical protein